MCFISNRSTPGGTLNQPLFFHFFLNRDIKWFSVFVNISTACCCCCCWMAIVDCLFHHFYIQVIRFTSIVYDCEECRRFRIDNNRTFWFFFDFTFFAYWLCSIAWQLSTKRFLLVSKWTRRSCFCFNHFNLSYEQIALSLFFLYLFG